MTDQLSHLAEKAVALQAALDNYWKHANSKDTCTGAILEPLREIIRPLRTEFESAATPQAIIALIKEKREMEEALKPFADLHDSWLKGHHKPANEVTDDETVPGKWTTVGDLRRAARALTPPSPGEST